MAFLKNLKLILLYYVSLFILLYNFFLFCFLPLLYWLLVSSVFGSNDVLKMKKDSSATRIDLAFDDFDPDPPPL